MLAQEVIDHKGSLHWKTWVDGETNSRILPGDQHH